MPTEKRENRADDYDRMVRVVLIYQSIMLLYYCMATMNGVREMLSPKGIKQNIELDGLRSAVALSSRADLRGNLWLLLAWRHLDLDEKKATQLSQISKHSKLDFTARYRATQLPMYLSAISTASREQLIARTDMIQKQLSEQDAIAAGARLFAYEPTA